MSDERNITDRDRTMVALGIGLGLAVSAGVAGEAGDMTHDQIGAMLERLSMEPSMLKAIADQVEADGHGQIDAETWKARMQHLMRMVTAQ